MKQSIIILILLFPQVHTFAQCNTPGQTPMTAVTVCTSDSFYFPSVPVCTNKPVLSGSCTPATKDLFLPYGDYNPIWFKITCYEPGTLGFVITPDKLSEDYSWELFDITGRTNYNDVYCEKWEDPTASKQLYVAANWSGTIGETGALNSVAGLNAFECVSGPSQGTLAFSQMPVLKLLHTYLLLVSHVSRSTNGFKIKFKGGDGKNYGCNFTKPGKSLQQL